MRVRRYADGEEGRAMRRSIIAAVVAAVLLTGWAMPSAAQQNGIVIQNNGVDSSDSAAGADNVRISNSPGNGQSLSGGGLNNATGRRRNAIARIEARGTTRTRLRPRSMRPRLRSMSPPAEGDYRPTRRGVCRARPGCRRKCRRRVDPTASAETAEHRSRH